MKFHASLLALKMQHFVFGNTSTLTPKTAAKEAKGNGVCLPPPGVAAATNAAGESGALKRPDA